MAIGVAELPQPAKEERCVCNKLVCVTKGDVIEIKCNKCKRILRIFTRGIRKIEVESENLLRN